MTDEERRRSRGSARDGAAQGEDSPSITMLIRDRRLCAPCIGRHARLEINQAEDVIGIISKPVGIISAPGRCEGCGAFAVVHKLA